MSKFPRTAYRVGQWLPSDQIFLDKWLEAIIQKTHAERKPLHPVIADFGDLIERDPEIFMLFNQMFEQVPRKPPYNNDPTGKPQVRSASTPVAVYNTARTPR
jgi:phosphatidylserine decarboxylase